MTDPITTTYSAPEISCDHCKSTIEGAVSGLGGVSRVEVDVDAKTVSVDGGEPEAIIAAIEDTGFDVIR